MVKFSLVVLACLSMTGCASFDAAMSGANTYLAGEIKAQQKNIQGADDNDIAAWSGLGCLIPYGAVVRNASTNPGLPKAIEALCGVLPAGGAPTALGGSVNK